MYHLPPSNYEDREPNMGDSLCQLPQYSADHVLTIPEVAAILRCSRAHVYNLINCRVSSTQRLPAIRMGRRVVVRWGAVKDWQREVEQASRYGDILRSSSDVDVADAWERTTHA